METFPVRLIDVSKYQDRYDTPYKPTFEKIVEEGFLGVIIRVGYGLVKDRMFDWFWSHARGLLMRGGYWFLDYYSHRGTGKTARRWGIEQADTCRQILGDDMGEMPFVLDCEASAAGGAVTYSNQREYNECAQGFADEWFRLTGKRVLLYTSPGFMWVFYSWAKTLDIWLAWYSRKLTRAQVLTKVETLKFTGVVRMWQYSSDGDINDDGIADGLTLGMESSGLDLSVFFGTVQEFSQWCGATMPVPTPEPIPTPEPLPSGTRYKVIAPSGVNLRDVPAGVAGTDIIGWKARETIINGIEVVAVGANLWLRVSTWTVAAIRYNGAELMKAV